MNTDVLSKLIEKGEDTVAFLGDPQKLADWVAEVESFLINENKLTHDSAIFIKNVKSQGLQSRDIYNLIAYLKQLGSNTHLPQITKRNQIFVAMWFGTEMDTVYNNAYKPVIQSLNFAAMRIDEKAFNTSIMDEICHEISNSVALIADLTNNRGGVYYEAGIARGLRICNHPIELIFTCRKDYFDKEESRPHFDVQGNNILVYSDNEDLKQKLVIRIRETVKG